MKFGALDFDLTVESYWNNSWNKRALLNVGDAAEYLAVEELYRSLNINDEQIVRLSIPELISYRGESLIVALNIALDSYVGYNDLLDHLSPDIIPVFLGMSFTNPELNSNQVACLKKYSPIGCRDERSFLTLRALGIPCYIFGCIASTLESDKENIIEYNNEKILFIDVPQKTAKFIPENIKKDIVFLNQEMYCKRPEKEKYFVPSEWARSIIAHYKNKPKLIVTSRFHGAVLALAFDIPVIITLEEYTFRFSWLRNYYPIYTESTFHQIDWAIRPVDYSSVRILMKKITQKRLTDTIEQYGDLLQITDLQSNGTVEEKGSTNQVLYYQKVLEEIRKTWSKDQAYTYGFWGINDNARAIYSVLSSEFPNAKLIDIFDMFKEVSFEHIVSMHPRELKIRAKENNYFVIVTAYLASRVAPDIFEESGFPSNRAFLCIRNFVEEKDL